MNKYVAGIVATVALSAGMMGGSAMANGVVFGVADWLGKMIMLMPMAAAGLFGMAMRIAAPMMTLVLHVIFGAVLGLVFQTRNAPRSAFGQGRHGSGNAVLRCPNPR